MGGPSRQEFNPDIARYNDGIATMYDTATQAEDWAVNGLIAEAMRERPADIHTALDLGAGTGQTTQTIDNLLHPQRIIAVDASGEMLKLLRSKIARPQIQTVHSTIEHYVENCKRKFNLIAAMGACEFVPDLPGILGKLAMLLEEGSTLLFTYIPQTKPDVSKRIFQVPSLKTAFTEYYWSAETIENTLALGGLTNIAKQSVDAYTRGTGKTQETVAYNFIAASKTFTSS